jgi:hypothetical protein
MSLRAALGVASRVTAALFGSLLFALVASVSLALLLPHPRTLGAAVGVTLAIPIWVAAMCPGFLARSAVKAWSIYLGSSALVALATYLLV